MTTVDTSSYGQQNQQNGMNTVLQLMREKQLLQQKGNKISNTNGTTTASGTATPTPMPTSSMNPGPYGSGTNMNQLGVGQPYGGFPTVPTSTDTVGSGN